MAVLGRWLHCPPALPASGSTELHPAATSTHPREAAAATRLKQVLTLLLHPPRACPQQRLKKPALKSHQHFKTPGLFPPRCCSPLLRLWSRGLLVETQTRPARDGSGEAAGPAAPGTQLSASTLPRGPRWHSGTGQGPPTGRLGLLRGAAPGAFTARRPLPLVAAAAPGAYGALTVTPAATFCGGHPLLQHCAKEQAQVSPKHEAGGHRPAPPVRGWWAPAWGWAVRAARRGSPAPGGDEVH